MQITEVRIKLMEESEDRLRAFCSITFDNAFVVRDLKIIEGAHGPFVAMPSRKLTSRCSKCGYKNHMRSGYCNQCGCRLRTSASPSDEDSPNKLYADIAHPINQACRDMIQAAVIEEYQQELVRAQQPGYVSRYDEEYAESTNLENPAQKKHPGPPEPHFDKKHDASSGQQSSGKADFGSGILES